MDTQEIKDEWPVLEENDPPLDWTREHTTFERERARLVRDHLGWIALIHGDEVVGAYPTLGAAFNEGVARFGSVCFICRLITEKDETICIPFLE